MEGRPQERLHAVPVCDAKINRVYRDLECRDMGEPYPKAISHTVGIQSGKTRRTTGRLDVSDSF